MTPLAPPDAFDELLASERARSEHLETELVETEKFLLGVAKTNQVGQTVIWKTIAGFLDERGIAHDLWEGRTMSGGRRS